MAHTVTNPQYPTAANGRMHGVELKYGAPVVDFGTGYPQVICTSCSITQAGELKEYKDEAGDVVTLVQIGAHEEFSMELYVANSEGTTSTPKQGDLFTFTIAGTTHKARVQSWQESWSNEDVTKVSMSARTYPMVDDVTGPTGS